MSDTDAYPGFSAEKESGQWVGILAGLWPFVLLGPLSLLLSYPYPLPSWRESAWFNGLVYGVYGASLLLGLAAGWRAKFPRWAYAYLGLLLLLLDYLAQAGLGILLSGWGIGLSAWLRFLADLLIYLILLGGLHVLTRLWTPLHPLRQSIRRDWSQLSFGLLVTGAWLFGLVDYRYDPELSLPAFLPAILLALGALAYLFSRTPGQGMAALLGGLVLAVILSLVNGRGFYLGFGAYLLALLMLPAVFAAAQPPPEQPA